MTTYLKALSEMPMIIDWAAIAAQGTSVRQQILAEEMALECLRQHGCLPIEEILQNRAVGGQTIIEAVDEIRRSNNGGDRQLGTYTLKVLRMHDNSAVKPGAIWVQRKGMRETYRDEFGVLRPMDTRTYARMKKISDRRGDRYDPDRWAEWKLDQDCCITCGYYDAMELIQNYGRFSTNAKLNKCFVQVMPATVADVVTPQQSDKRDRAQAR